MKNIHQEKMKYRIGGIVVLCVTLFVYFPAINHFPRADHVAFLAEITNITGLKNLIGTTYSFCRTRLFPVGDELLFRPLFFVILCLQKWLFGYQFVYWQITSIALHLLVLFQLYQVLQLMHKNILSLFFVLSFSVVHISQEMVIWQHVSPYLLCMFFLLKAMYHFLKIIKLQNAPLNDLLITSLCLWGANLLFEFSLFCNLIFVIIYGVIHLRGYKKRILCHEAKDSQTNNRRILLGVGGRSIFIEILILTIPFITVLLWNVVDYHAHVEKTAIGLSSFNVLSFAKYFFQISVFSLLGPLIPNFIKIYPYDRLTLETLNIKEIFSSLHVNEVFVILNGLLLILVLIIVIYSFFRNFIRKESVGLMPCIAKEHYPSMWMVLLSLLLFVGFIIAVGLGRVHYWGIMHIQRNLYYFYFILTFQVIAVYGLIMSLRQGKTRADKICAMMLFVALCLVVVLNGAKNFTLNQRIKTMNVDFQKYVNQIGKEKFFQARHYTETCSTYYREGNVAVALEFCNQALDLNPKDVKALNSRGAIFDVFNKYDLALDDFNRAIALNPNYYDAYNNRGNIYLMQDQYDLALKDFNIAIKIDPQNADAYNNRGIIYKYYKQYDDALNDFNKAISLRPDLMQAYSNRIFINQARGEDKQVINDFTKLLEINPHLIKVYHSRGLIYAKKNDYRKALEDFDKLIELSPNNVTAYLNRALCRSEIGLFDLAIEDYNQVIRLDPDNLKVYHDRGALYGRLRKSDLALADLNEVIRRDSNYITAYLNRALVRAMSGDYPQALKDALKAKELGYPVDAEFIKVLKSHVLDPKEMNE